MLDVGTHVTQDKEAVIAVPLSLKSHFDRMDAPPYGDAAVVFVDPSHPGHDFLNPADSQKPCVFARVSAALQRGFGRP